MANKETFIGEAPIESTPRTPFKFKLKAGSVGAENLKDKSVTANKIADNAVGNRQLAANSVESSNIVGGAVTTDQLADNSITTAKIQNNAVTENKIDDEAVTTQKIASNAVTGSKITDNAITEDKIADNAITNNKIVDGTITGDKFRDDSIDGSKIKNNSVPGSKLADGAIGAVDIQDNTLSGSKLVDNSVDGAKLVGGAVTTAKLKDNSIDGSKIADGTIQGLDIKDGTIPGTKLKDNSISGQKLKDGIIDNTKLADNSIPGSKLLDESINGEKIQPNTIHGSKLENNTVDGADIIDGTLDGSKLKDNSIEDSKIVANAIETRHIKSNTISGTKIANDAIDSTKIRNNSLVGDNFANGAVTEGKLQNDTIATRHIADNAVTTGKIADNAVTTDKIPNGAVTVDKLAPQAVQQITDLETQFQGNETTRQTNETTRISNETGRVNAESGRVEAETSRVSAETSRDSAETTRQSNETTRQSNETTRENNETTRQSNETQRQTNETNRTETASTDHNTAVEDHNQAATDHNTAVSDHSIAEEDHIQAVTDHNTAATDHTTATTDHSTAADDHATAASDHTTATTDHTRAESDHTNIINAIASADLVFDISLAHASEGVLAQYADLATALGTDGANVPSENRHGGMTVKFVQSSDNKYVQYRYMSSSIADADFVNVVNWQGVDGEITEGSNNLPTSNAVHNAISDLYNDIDEIMVDKMSWINLSNNVYLENGTYNNARYTTTSADRLRCVSFLPIPIIEKYKATMLRFTINSEYNYGRQLFKNTFQDISGQIAVNSEQVFNDAYWQSGTTELSLRNYPLPVTFGIVIKRADGNDISPTEDTGLQIEIYGVNGWESVEKLLDGIYTPIRNYSLLNIGTTLARGQFPVIPNHNYTIKVVPWDHSSVPTNLGYLIVFEDGYLSNIPLAGSWTGEGFKSEYNFTPTQNIVGVSTRGNFGTIAYMEIIDNDGGSVRKLEKRVSKLEDEVDSFGQYSYIGEKINLQQRTYNKESFLVTNSSALTTINDVIVTQMGHSLIIQSCAVYGKYFVRAYQYGGIAIYDLETKTLVANFMLPLASSELETLHASNISFGVEFPSENTTFPALYVCETTGSRRCFVFDIGFDGATLLQTITFNGSWGTGNDYRDFIVDSQNRCLWIVGYYNYNVSGNYTICKKVDLRSISSPTIVYGDSDVQQSFEIRDINVIQGVFIWNDHMYIGDQRRWIVNIDLVQGKEVGHIDFSSFMGELEGLANYNGDLLVDNSTVYKLSLY